VNQPLRIVRRSAFKAVPWKNGGGTTHEAWRDPENGDPFRWRVSIAQVDQSGPFSDFSGYRRKMVLLRGAGIELKFADGQQLSLTQIGDMAEFDGGMATHGNLRAGPCMDLNLMVAYQHPVRSRVERLTGPADVGASELQTTVIVSLESALEIKRSNGEVALLGPWDLAVISGFYGQVISSQAAISTTPKAVFFATIEH
jgi:environmental stress-induced protein Ves